MIFPEKKLAKSHSDVYRQIQLPASVSSIWIQAGVEHVVIEYVEARGEAGDYLVVRPVRPMRDVAQAKATTKAQATTETKAATNHLPSSHFGI